MNARSLLFSDALILHSLVAKSVLNETTVLSAQAVRLAWYLATKTLNFRRLTYSTNDALLEKAFSYTKSKRTLYRVLSELRGSNIFIVDSIELGNYKVTVNIPGIIKILENTRSISNKQTAIAIKIYKKYNESGTMKLESTIKEAKGNSKPKSRSQLNVVAAFRFISDKCVERGISYTSDHGPRAAGMMKAYIRECDANDYDIEELLTKAIKSWNHIQYYLVVNFGAKRLTNKQGYTWFDFEAFYAYRRDIDFYLKAVELSESEYLTHREVCAVLKDHGITMTGAFKIKDLTDKKREELDRSCQIMKKWSTSSHGTSQQ